MILHRVAARSVGPFTGSPVEVGPFAPGLNVLWAPNETGKTTLLKAAGRTLFDRHNCKAEEIYALQPAGTSLAPTVSVEFETGTGRFRIEKTFLQNPRSALSEWTGSTWALRDEGDAADNRLTALLQTTRAAKGATNAAHWGMLGYLWMRQGEGAEWPDWQKHPAAQEVRGLLVKVEIDPFIEGVRQRLWTAFTDNFTPATHQPRAGGTLLAAEQELARVAAELAAVADTRRQFVADQEAYDRLSAELPALEEEHAAARREADALREATARAALLRVEVDRCREAVEGARVRLRSVQADADAARRHATEASRLATALAAAQTEATRLAQAATSAQERLRATETAQEEAARVLALAQAEVNRLGQRGRAQRLADEIARDTLALERATAQATAQETLRLRRAELPTIPPARLARLDRLQEAILAARARMEALGLTVELIPLAAAAAATVRADDAPAVSLPDLAAAQPRVVHAAQTLTLDLPGWGTVRVRSGAGETRAARDALAADEATLRQELAALGVATAAEARGLADQARELDARLEATRRPPTDEANPDALRTRLAAARRQREILTAELSPRTGTPDDLAATGNATVVASSPATDEPTTPEAALSFAALEAAEQAATVRADALRAELRALERRVKEHRDLAIQATQAREQGERATLTLRLETEGLGRQAAELQARYSGHLDAASQQANEDFAIASFALKQAEGTLPADAAQLPERNRRAAAAAEQIAGELRTRQGALATLTGRLELLGSHGLHEREANLLARRDAHELQVAQARTRSRAARLVHDLIERRKQAATRAVLAPLQDRLGARFAEVSGERERRIFLSESLAVRGLGRREDDLVPFDDLSQGAKEQLLLCLRLAVAEELQAKGGGPQSLILDDVLVNTDRDRQRRVLDVLSSAAASGLQILVCTCHPDRYRGVGQVVELRRPAN